jgi:hypothetical protein
MRHAAIVTLADRSRRADDGFEAAPASRPDLG